MEAMRWLVNEDPEPGEDVLLRPDSEYVIGVVTGDQTPSANLSMVRAARALYNTLEWAVPVGNAPTGVDCLRAIDVSEITRVQKATRAANTLRTAPKRKRVARTTNATGRAPRLEKDGTPSGRTQAQEARGLIGAIEEHCGRDRSAET